MEQYLIGIDDTDNQSSRGTGFLSRQLAAMIHRYQLGSVQSISRHQLFIAPSIPYTSQNSSACLLVNSAKQSQLQGFAESYLLEHAAEGSDVGLCVVLEKHVSEKIRQFGFRAKKEVLTQAEANALAEADQVFLKGLTGTHDGIIGALAAVGLRKSGDDGRCIWLSGKELRELEGAFTLKEWKQLIAIDGAEDVHGNSLKENDKIFAGNWVRPVIRKGKILIIAERFKHRDDEGYKVADKVLIKSLSD